MGINSKGSKHPSPRGPSGPHGGTPKQAGYGHNLQNLKQSSFGKSHATPMGTAKSGGGGKMRSGSGIKATGDRQGGKSGN